MKIVVLEKIKMSKEQIKRLESLGKVKFYDNSTIKKAKERVKDANVVIIDWIEPNEFLEDIKPGSLLALMSTGYGWIDLKKARSLGITITNIPGYATEAVAEHAFGLMLSVLRKIVLANKSVKGGKWIKDPFRGSELKDKTLGIIGLGRIGSRLAEIGQGFGMKIVGYDRNPRHLKDVKMVNLEELLKKSDIISLHCDLNPSSENLIGEKEFNLMKPEAILINTSAGKVVDTNALVEALKTKKISGAGIDVLPEEPNLNNPLLKLDNLVLTPEIGFNTKEALERRVDICINNIKAFIKSKPQNVVN